MELTKSSISFSRLLLDSWNNYEETTDAIVPDTFPDIARIAAVYGNVQLKDDTPQAGRVLISGNVRMTVLYVPDCGGPMKRLDIPISFAHIEEAAGMTESSQLFVSCRVISADAHVMNSRKLSVTAELSLCCRVFMQDTAELTDGFSDADDLELLTDTRTVTLPVCIHRQECTLMDELPLADAARFSELLAPRADIRLSDCRLMNGKAVLKGDAALHFVAVTTEDALEHIDCVLPFTQIFEVDTMTEQQQITAGFSVRHLDCVLQEDGQISIGLGICVLLTAFETHTIPLIADVYHLRYPVYTETQAVTLPACRPLTEIGCEASETIPVGMKIAQIVDITAVLDTLLHDSSRTILRMMAGIVYRSDDGEYYSVHRAVHVPLNLPADIHAVRVSDMQCRASGSISGEDSIVLSLSGRCSLFCDEPVPINTITSLTVDDAALADPSPIAVILRWIDREERLWDIAKQYHTTVRAIQQANQLDTEQVHAQMLLIPVR